MTLAALIAAYHESSEAGGGLRATLPLAGRTLVERQARLAAMAGASPIVILVERVPPALLAAVDRLRAEGLSVAVARSAAEAADMIHPSLPLLLFADGVIADASHVTRLTSAGGAALLTVPDQAVDDRFERIDAEARWAGVAYLDGDLLRRTTASLQDWDLQSTLLRRALQGGARQFSIGGEAGIDRLTIAERTSDLQDAEARILAGSSTGQGSWVSRFLLAPLEQTATRLLMPGAVTSEMFYVLAAVLTGLAALMFLKGWLAAGAVLLLLATPLDGIAQRLGRLRMQLARPPRWWSHALPLLGSAALLALAYALSGTRGWGCLALAGATLAFLLALRGESGPIEVERMWLAERKGLTWLMLPFAVTNFWTTGLAALAIYAAGSFFWVQRHMHRPFSAPKQD